MKNEFKKFFLSKFYFYSNKMDLHFYEALSNNNYYYMTHVTAFIKDIKYKKAFNFDVEETTF